MKTQRYLLLLLFCLATLSILGQTIPSFADKRVALVIGNGSYQYTPALINPPSDAKDVAEALKAIGFDVKGKRRTPCSSTTPATACSSRARTS